MMWVARGIQASAATGQGVVDVDADAQDRIGRTLRIPARLQQHAGHLARMRVRRHVYHVIRPVQGKVGQSGVGFFDGLKDCQASQQRDPIAYAVPQPIPQQDAYGDGAAADIHPSALVASPSFRLDFSEYQRATGMGPCQRVNHIHGGTTTSVGVDGVANGLVPEAGFEAAVIHDTNATSVTD